MKGFGKVSSDEEKRLKIRLARKIEKALALHSKGAIDKAYIQYNQIIRSGIEDPRVYSALGLIALQNSEVEKSIKYNLKSIAINNKYLAGYLNLGVIYCQIGNYEEAEKNTRKAIKIDPRNTQSILNLGEILLKMLKLGEAEEEVQKAINLSPDSIEAYYILSKILKEKEEYYEAERVIKKAISISPKLSTSYYLLHEIYLQMGDLENAKEYLYKTIDLNPNFASAYYSLSRFYNKEKDNVIYKRILEMNISEIKVIKDKISILFAKSNILHEKNKYKDSANFLKKANDLKLSIYNSSASQLIEISKDNLIKTNSLKCYDNSDSKEIKECIFIVGMPRSGSTLIESILYTNENVIDLGERPLVEMSLKRIFEIKDKSNHCESLYKLYIKERNKFVRDNYISTDKYLYNYLYLGNILNSFPNAKIIHSIRNPLDNILSIYRANFQEGVRFSSSLNDCARIYVNHLKTIEEYKKRFPGKIYSINYDLLVTIPDMEIRKLIKWLDWEWDDRYLSPHQVNRNIKTASVVQVRSPINSSSINGWKQYRKMLEPAINELRKNKLIK